MDPRFLAGLTVREFYLLVILIRSSPISISDAVLFTGSHWSTVQKSIDKLEKMRLVRTERRYDLPSHPTYVYPTKGTHHVAHLLKQLEEGLREHIPN